MLPLSIEKWIPHYLEEDDLFRHDTYWQKLPKTEVIGQLNFKTDKTRCAGLPYFVAVFDYFLKGERKEQFQTLLQWEGKEVGPKTPVPTITLPFNVALTGERLALNLLQKASSIATYTEKLVTKAQTKGIAILETRKTTPGLRSLEKYAVQLGGGHNHRFGQTDLFMIKDNHKAIMGGLSGAVTFFRNLQSFYTPLIAEIHSLEELHEAIQLQLPHVMLDRFTLEDIQKAVAIKPDSMTYEISGGVTLENIDQYLIKGISAISLGSLTYGAPPVDISFKFSPLQ